MDIKEIQEITGFEQKSGARALLMLHEEIGNVHSKVMHRIFDSEHYKEFGFMDSDKPIIDALKKLDDAKMQTLGWLTEMAIQEGGKNGG